jgi:ATP-binding cassette subfamily E protein 1
MSRIAIVNKEKCHPHECGDYLCMKLCPVNRNGSDCIVVDEDSKRAKINEELCIGCGICPKRCPYEAISIINLPEELDSQIIHKYGQNGFHLYNLPTPIFGKVVGLIGRNGIGKSTAIKILAGYLKPNLGEDGKEANYDELIEFFKGTEAQSFFEKLKAGEIKVAYKLQEVNQIAENFKGKVSELLKKVDERKIYDEVVEKLSLKHILDNDVSKISGGELQRVAIAATVMKDANLYLFDEPTSYLDIKQRIKVSQFIRELANDDTAVMVIEHDLIILDYMTDLIHLMYGKQGAYGIVSQPKTTKAGINVYLSGYLKEENMRFRENEIKFPEKAPSESHQENLLTSWTDTEKKLGHFQLKANAGELYKHDVVGILGENGIGKTSFVKILAGVEKADSGKVEEEIKIAYKPQYLEKSDELVMVVLQDAIKKHNNDVIGPLEIQPLMTRKLSQLSGGELQRVAIALCLSQDVDLFLMDEPSAYLDVEQRLIVSKVIRERLEMSGKTAMIVDHDLLFVDYISDKLLVFEGEPAISGEAAGPYTMREGMNIFLKDLELTFRRDEESNRPRANKQDSQLDRSQKSQNQLYYTG